jgi:hypothetical protein
VNLYEFSQQISQLKKDEKYDEVMAFFKQNKASFANEEIAKNEYIISDMLLSLRKLSRYNAGFKFLDIYNIEINNNTKERIITAYGWLLWSKYKSENTSNNNVQGEIEDDFDDEESGHPVEINYQKSEIIIKIEQLIPFLYEQDTPYSKILISNLFNVVLKCEKTKPSTNWNLVDKFCNHFSPSRLEMECRTIKVERKGIKKDMELASDRENWYAHKTMALQKLGRWQECLDLSKNALDNIKTFHYSNDAWFSRRIALAKKNLGSPEETIIELESILLKKKEWFIQKELAEIFFEKNNVEVANKYALEAANNFGELEFKWDLLFLMGNIYLAMEKEDLAFKHFSLSKLIRSSQNPPWKIPQKLIDILNKFDNDEININELDSLSSELKGLWRSSVPKDKFTGNDEVQEGVVKKILHSNEKGKDGFLVGNNVDYYFNLFANNPLVSKIELDKKVMFKMLPNDDQNRPRVKIIKVIN